MANLICSLFVKLTANTTDFQSGMQKAERRVQSTAKQFEQATRSVKNLASSLGLVVGVGALTRMANNAIQAGSAITDMAVATRTGVEEIQALNYAARTAGASNEQMANLLIRVQKSASDAARGLSTAKDAFAKLNIDTAAFLEMSPERMLEEVGKALVKAGDDTRAYGAALDILGTRNAPKLMEVMQRLGREGFDNLAQSALNAGQVMSEDFANKMDATADKMEEFNTRMTNFSASVVSGIMDIGDALGTLAGAAVYGDPDKYLRKFAENQLRSEGAFENLRGRGAARKKQSLIDARVEDILRKEAEVNVRAERVAKLAQGSVESSPVIEEASATVDAFLAGMVEMEFQTDQLVTKAQGLGAELNATLVVGELRSMDLTSALEDLAFDGFGSVEKSVADLQESIDAWQNDVAYGITSIAGAIEDGLINAARDGKAAFGDMANYILAEIQRIVLRALVLRPLFTGIGNSFFGGTSTEIGSAFVGAFGGGKAAGGPVNAGMTYLVGDSGPELLTMGSSGYVTPNGRMGGGTVVNIDNRGADPAAIQRLEGLLRRLDRSVEVRAVAAVGDRYSRKPSYLGR